MREVMGWPIRQRMVRRSPPWERAQGRRKPIIKRHCRCLHRAITCSGCLTILLSPVLPAPRRERGLPAGQSAAMGHAQQLLPPLGTDLALTTPECWRVDPNLVARPVFEPRTDWTPVTRRPPRLPPLTIGIDDFSEIDL